MYPDPRTLVVPVIEAGVSLSDVVRTRILLTRIEDRESVVDMIEVVNYVCKGGILIAPQCVADTNMVGIRT